MLKPLLLLALLAATPLLAQQPAAPASAPPPDPTARLQQLLTTAVARNHFTGAVLVVHHGAILLDEGYGAADLEWNIPNSPSAKFRIGSLTKQFTAVSFLLLQERGRLNLQDPILKYMPDAPAAWHDITLFQLLTHTSGIPNFTSFPDYPTTEWRDTNPTELVDRFRSKPLDFPPGSKFSYSNSGYVLLGFLLEKITGTSYSDFLQTNIFSPLHMDSTRLDSNTAIIPNRARGYVQSGGSQSGFRHAGYTSMTIPFSAGALLSTTGDLLKWQNALFSGNLLTPASLRQMTTPAPATGASRYGLGVFLTAEAGHPSVAHTGGIEGFLSYMVRFPQDDLSVIVLSNSESSSPETLGTALARVALGLPASTPAPPRTEVPVPVATLALYPGTYRISPTFAITVTLEEGHLLAQATNQPKFNLFPESETSFFLKAVDAQIEFHVDPATHRPTGLTLHQNGRNIPAPRE